MKIIIINIMVGLSAVGWVAYVFLSSYGAAFGSASGQSSWSKVPSFVIWSVILVAILSIILSHIDRPRALLWSVIPLVWIAAMYIYIGTIKQNYKETLVPQNEIDELETRRKPVSQDQIDTYIKFDIKAYEDRIKQKSEGDNTSEVVYVGANSNSFNEFTYDRWYIQKETQKDGAYIFYRVFYNTGNLKTEGKMAKFGGGNALLGEWKTYDKNGNVIKTEDYESGFKITYEAVLEICKKRNIDLNEKGISFYRSRPGQPAVWLIEWSTGEGPIPGSEVGSIGYSAGISIDGVTGVVTEIPYNRL